MAVYNLTICKRKTSIKKIKTRERGYLKSMSSKFHPRNLNFLLPSHSYSYFKILIFVCLTSVVSYIYIYIYIYTCLCYILFSLPPIACFGWRPHQKLLFSLPPIACFGRRSHQKFSDIIKSKKEIIIYIHALSYLGCFY